MKLEIDQGANEVVIRMPLRNDRNSPGGKPTTVAGGEESITADLDGIPQIFRVRANVSYHFREAKSK